MEGGGGWGTPPSLSNLVKVCDVMTDSLTFSTQLIFNITLIFLIIQPLKHRRESSPLVTNSNELVLVIPHNDLGAQKL